MGLFATSFDYDPPVLTGGSVTLNALDPESEEAVRQTMETLKGQLSILAISHNRAMVQAADHVYQLMDGRAIALDAESRSSLAK